MRRFSHYGYEPGGTIDWNQELATPAVGTVAPTVTDTETGIPYYLARPTDPYTTSGYEQAYTPNYYPGGVGSQQQGQGAGAQVWDFFKNLMGGVGSAMQPKQPVVYYQPPRQKSSAGWIGPALGVAAGVGVAYFLLRR